METPRKKPPDTSRLGFKSYYVVWKLSGEEKTKLLLEAFKSYYVVWKHDFQRGIGRRWGGLNRTM